jgi:hypothetical protein
MRLKASWDDLFDSGEESWEDIWDCGLGYAQRGADFGNRPAAERHRKPQTADYDMGKK